MSNSPAPAPILSVEFDAATATWFVARTVVLKSGFASNQDAWRWLDRHGDTNLVEAVSPFSLC